MNKTYRIAELKNHKLVPKAKICEEEYESYIEQSMVLDVFSMAKLYFDIFMGNAAECDVCYGSIKKDVALGRIRSEADIRERVANINRYIFNYLMSFRIFVDTLQSRCVKRMENGEEFLRKTLNETYDKEPIYAFIYELRNFAMHFAVVIDHGAVQSDGMIFDCSKANLLRFDWKDANRDFLNAQPDFIDIYGMITYIDGLVMKIYLEFLKAVKPEVAKVFELHESLKKKYNISGSLFVMAFRKNDSLTFEYGGLNGGMLKAWSEDYEKFKSI